MNTVQLTLDEFIPSPPPIREGFTDGLHDIINLFTVMTAAAV
jgi:hypothetical protein